MSAVPRRLTTFVAHLQVEQTSRCISRLGLNLCISMIAVVDLRWRFGPEPSVEDQQADGDQAPDQAVEPGHPGRVGTGRPQGAGLDGAIASVRDQGKERTA